jgi:ABC-type phosphate transport system substrate-binding protein
MAAALLMGVRSAVAVGEEPLAIIVPLSSGHTTLTKDELAAIYRRKRRYWAGPLPIEPVNLPATDRYRRAFSHLVLGQFPEEMEDYWNEQYFHGITPPYVVDSVEAALRFVEKTPGAIGYVPLCSADHRVAVLVVLEPGGTLTTAATAPSCRK